MISSLLRVCWQSSNSVQQISMIHAASSSHEYLFSQNHASERDSFKLGEECSGEFWERQVGSKKRQQL